MSFAESVNERITGARGPGWRKGQIEVIDTTTNPDSFIVAGRTMPILDNGQTLALGDVIVYWDGPNPFGLGKLVDT